MTFDHTLDQAISLRDRQGKLEAADRIFQSLAKQLDSLSDEERIKLCVEYGSQLRYQGRMTEALHWYKKGLAIAKKIHHQSAVVDFSRLISFTSLKVSSTTTVARRWADKSIAGLRPLTGKERDLAAANVWALVGNTESTDKNAGKAIAAYQKALGHAKKAKFYARVATLLGDLANKYMDLGEYQKAEQALKEDARLSKKYHRHSYPNALVRLSYLYNLPKNPRRDLKKAWKYAEEALKISKKEGWGREIADAYQRLGKIAWYMGKKAESKRYLLLAIAQYKKVKHVAYAKWVKKVMTDLDRGINSHHDYPQE